MLEHAETLREDDHLLMLVSGGGSALMCLPAEGLALADKIMINERLLASGLDIHAMNAVRRFCSGIKGGRLQGRRHLPPSPNGCCLMSCQQEMI